MPMFAAHVLLFVDSLWTTVFSKTTVMSSQTFCIWGIRCSDFLKLRCCPSGASVAAHVVCFFKPIDLSSLDLHDCCVTAA